MNDYSVQSRLRGVGVLTKEQALLYGAVGPMARASGIEIDTRKLGYEAYGDAEFDIITSTDCDGYARCRVRIGELFQSIGIIRQLAAKVPDSQLTVPIKGMPKGEAIVRVEQPRGEASIIRKPTAPSFWSAFVCAPLPLPICMHSCTFCLAASWQMCRCRS